jgi:hypothetical protein
MAPETGRYAGRIVGVSPVDIHKHMGIDIFPPGLNVIGGSGGQIVKGGSMALQAGGARLINGVVGVKDQVGYNRGACEGGLFNGRLFRKAERGPEYQGLGWLGNVLNGRTLCHRFFGSAGNKEPQCQKDKT